MVHQLGENTDLAEDWSSDPGTHMGGSHPLCPHDPGI